MELVFHPFKRRRTTIFNCTAILFIVLNTLSSQQVLSGIDQLDTFLPLLQGKRVGIVSNQTSVNTKGTHLLHILSERRVKVYAIFAPEHGFKGDIENGRFVKSDKAQHIYSLYGKDKKPYPHQLKDIDIVIYDMQDVGTRFYTYISTLGYVMEACAETGTSLLVLDRPVFLGDRVEGGILKKEHHSFIGMYPIPTVYGMTVGELAQMIKGERWMAAQNNLDLNVIPLKHWKRQEFEPITFVPPSPNIPDLETTYLYAALCYLEGTNISEGRGTSEPFKQFGAPWFNADAFLKEFNTLTPYGVQAEKTLFTPQTIKGKAYQPKHEGKKCNGIKLKLTEKPSFNSIFVALNILHCLQKTQPQFKIDRVEHFERLVGDSHITAGLEKKNLIEVYTIMVQKDAWLFRAKRKPYLLY